mmetsp:Transcript_30029/g.79772  ORF Transcript_30029/g.79772 Transcript_30029/m.79772 type:complete len:353 (-) Transcript_30029:2-1060(-)
MRDYRGSHDEILRLVRVWPYALAEVEYLLRGVHIPLRHRVHVVGIEAVAVSAIFPRSLHGARGDVGHVREVPHLVPESKLHVLRVGLLIVHVVSRGRDDHQGAEHVLLLHVLALHACPCLAALGLVSLFAPVQVGAVPEAAHERRNRHLSLGQRVLECSLLQLGETREPVPLEPYPPLAQDVAEEVLDVRCGLAALDLLGGEHLGRRVAPVQRPVLVRPRGARLLVGAAVRGVARASRGRLAPVQGLLDGRLLRGLLGGLRGRGRRARGAPVRALAAGVAPPLRRGVVPGAPGRGVVLGEDVLAVQGRLRQPPGPLRLVVHGVPLRSLRRLRRLRRHRGARPRNPPGGARGT